MNTNRQNQTEISRIARLTLPPCEVEFKAFELVELQGYVELVDHAVCQASPETPLNVEMPAGFGGLSEPAISFQMRVEAS